MKHRLHGESADVMRKSRQAAAAHSGTRRQRRTVLVAAIVGAGLAVPAAGVAARLFESGDSFELGLHHNPPIFADAGGHVTLEVGGVCGIHSILESLECNLEGTVAHRYRGEEVWTHSELEPTNTHENLIGTMLHLEANGPPEAIEYYFEVSDPSSGVMELLPLGGEATPATLTVVAEPTEITLADEAPLFPYVPRFVAPWGNGPLEVGFVPGNESTSTAPSSFDIDAHGRLLVYDAANQRLVISRGEQELAFIHSPTQASLVDVAVAGNGMIFLLELSPGGDSTLDLYRSADDLSEFIHVGPISESIADQLRRARDGVVAHQYPSDRWWPVATDAGTAIELREQMELSTTGRPSGDDTELLFKVTEDFFQVGAGVDTSEAWSVKVATPHRFGEGQLAEVLPTGDVGVVVRQIDGDHIVFRILRITRTGDLLFDGTVPTGDWTDAAPVSRFRVSPSGSLYQLQTTEDAFQIVEVDW